MENKLYRAYSDYLKERYGEKVYKLPVNLPLTCPNRIGSYGCTFCADVGTGFEAMEQSVPVVEQLTQTKEKIQKKYHAKQFLAYFQNYTNTFLPLHQLLAFMEEAVTVEGIVGISISTRPDCIREDYLEAIADFRKKHDVDIYFELGLQSISHHTLKAINRGHSLAEWIDAVLRLHRFGFELCTHVILNLPTDTMEDIIEMAKILSAMPIQMVKIHSLYIPYGTKMCTQYQKREIEVCSKEEYIERLVVFVELLRADLVIERLFSRVPEEDACFSNWGTSWWKLKDEFEEKMLERKSVQGCACTYLNGSALNKGGF